MCTMTAHLNRQRWLGIVLVLTANAGFSMKSIFAKLAYRAGADALTLVSWRMLLSLPFFLLATWWSSRQPQALPLRREEWRELILLGVAGYYLSSVLDFEGLMFISASLERLALFLYPTLVVLLSIFFKGYQPNRRTLLALILSYSGIVLVVTTDLGGRQEYRVLGFILVLAAAFSYALYLVGSQSLISRLGAIRYTGNVLTIATLCTLIQTSLQCGGELLNVSPKVFWLGAGTAVFSTVMPVFLLTAGISRIGSEQSALLGSIGPVATMGLAAWWLGEPVTIAQLTGAALIIGGVVTLTRR